MLNTEIFVLAVLTHPLLGGFFPPHLFRDAIPLCGSSFASKSFLVLGQLYYRASFKGMKVERPSIVRIDASSQLF